MLDLTDIGARVRATRKARRLTQSALGASAGVSRAQIDRLENGRLADIRFSALARLLAVLGLELRLTDANRGRPTLEDLAREEEEP